MRRTTAPPQIIGVTDGDAVAARVGPDFPLRTILIIRTLATLRPGRDDGRKIGLCIDFWLIGLRLRAANSPVISIATDRRFVIGERA